MFHLPGGEHHTLIFVLFSETMNYPMYGDFSARMEIRDNIQEQIREQIPLVQAESGCRNIQFASQQSSCLIFTGTTESIAVARRMMEQIIDVGQGQGTPGTTRHLHYVRCNNCMKAESPKDFIVEDKPRFYSLGCYFSCNTKLAFWR